MTADDIIRQIATMHWDMIACRCWVCEAGRELGIHANEDFLNWHDKFEYVDVVWSVMRPKASDAGIIRKGQRTKERNL